MKRFPIFLLVLTLGLVSNFTHAQTADDYNSNSATQPADDNASAVTETVQTTTTSTQTASTSAVDNTKMAMRKLWEDHIVWTRNYIISAIAGLKDIDAVTTRLLKNQDDIGDAIKPYYGDDAGNKLAKLLREHILIATKVVKAAKAGNKAALDKTQKEWSANADAIATFLSDANSNWSKTDLLSALQMHLDLTTQEASARLHKDWQDDIKAYDTNHDHMLMFSDDLVGGIAKQFPDKFSG